VNDESGDARIIDSGHNWISWNNIRHEIICNTLSLKTVNSRWNSKLRFITEHDHPIFLMIIYPLDSVPVPLGFICLCGLLIKLKKISSFLWKRGLKHHVMCSPLVKMYGCQVEGI
jgi:hypothetical protein